MNDLIVRTTTLSAREARLVHREAMRRLSYAPFLLAIVLVTGTFGYMIIEGWRVLDSIYMTVITIATVGFHEVAEMSDRGRIFTVILIFFGIGVGGYAIANIAAFLIEGEVRDILRGRKMAKEITNLKEHVIVCGFGKIGAEVCRNLSEAGQDFIVVESDPNLVDEALAKEYLAVVGDASDDEILEKCGIQNARGLISAISDDSANVYLVLTARSLNENLHIIARAVDEPSRKKLLRAGANKVVSPFAIGARRMAALILRPEIVDFVEALSTGTDLGLHLERLEIGKHSKLLGKRLDESHIKRDSGGAMVLGIQKRGQRMAINPHGSTTLDDGDLLLVIGNDKQLVKLGQLLG